MRFNSVGRLVALIMGVFFFVVVVFFLYVKLSSQVEVQHVKDAVKRDCSIELEISSNDIREPGVVIKDYVDNGTPMRLICQGPNWMCTCKSNP